METKLLPCPFCGSTKICMDGGDSIYWCRCLDCGAMDVFDVWQKRALSERHQRLVGLLSDIKGDLGSAEWGTPEHGEEILMGLIDKYYPKIKAALEGEGR